MANTLIGVLNQTAKARLDPLDYNIETPSDRTYYISINTPIGYDIENITTKTLSGTCTCDFRINNVSIGGCGAIAVTGTRAVTTCTTPKTWPVGGILSVTVSSSSTPDMLAISFALRRNGVEGF